MSVVEEMIDVDAIVPDGIEPVEADRCWNLVNGKLCSLNGTPWTPGEPHAAECKSGHGRHSWNVVRHGVPREAAESMVASHNAHLYSIAYGSTIYTMPSFHPAVPSVELPDGYGFALETVTHDAPDPGCSCGIYAAETADQLPGGQVYGKVKLWGSVIPGERGYRAQYAYPSEFRVHPSLANNRTLKAFGVPIIVADTPPAFTPPPFDPDKPLRFGLSPAVRFAVAANVCAAALNVGMLALRSFS